MNINLTVEEIAFVMNELTREHHDGTDFEPECPSCTAYTKLKAAVDWDERHGTAGVAVRQPTEQEDRWLHGAARASSTVVAPGKLADGVLESVDTSGQCAAPHSVCPDKARCNAAGTCVADGVAGAVQPGEKSCP